MKKLLTLLFISITLYSQEVTVVENKIILETDQGFYFPKYNHDDSALLLSSSSYDGLWIYSFNFVQPIQITDAAGSGYEAVFSSDGENVVFRSNHFENGRRYSSLILKNIKNGDEYFIEKDKRNLYPVCAQNFSEIYYRHENNLKSFMMNQSLQKSQNKTPIVFINNSKINLIEDNSSKILEPLGIGNYIWPSISPDGTKLLFTKAGKGTFISDLDGNIQVELGVANYPSWSSDGKWIVYMVDKDDGVNVIDSDIFIVSADGKSQYQLTNTVDVFEMHPSWANQSNKIIYHTTVGKIGQIIIEFN